MLTPVGRPKGKWGTTMRIEDPAHLGVRIAMETGFPVEVVRETYLAAFLELSADDRVHAYLPLFAAKLHNHSASQCQRRVCNSNFPLRLGCKRGPS
uniref:DUF3562 domain-containing protein n=1 Tax=Cupriavidus ulmosensis TaxID=3065913 RepID=UPI003F863FEF